MNAPKENATRQGGAETAVLANERKTNFITSPRERRILRALLDGPVTRRAADKIAHASNAPDIIFRLRARGVGILTERIPCRDFDGRPTHYGRYELAGTAARAKARALLHGGRT